MLKSRMVSNLFSLFWAITLALFTTGFNPKFVMADSSCNPLTDFCIIGLVPNVGSTDGGASIGSNQLTDPAGNEYNAPTYNANEPITITHSGYNFGQYQYLDYISFNGTQYVNTGISYLTTDTSIRMDIDVLSTRGAHGIDPPTTSLEQLNGSRHYLSSGSNWRFFLSFYQGSYSNGTYWATVGTGVTYTGVNLGTTNPPLHESFGVEYNRTTQINTGYRNNTPVDIVSGIVGPEDSNNNPVNIGPILLGAVNNGSFGIVNPGYFAEQDVYGFTLAKDGVMVADYKPVWNIITQEYGFHDIVTGDFILSTNEIPFTGPSEDKNNQPLNYGAITATIIVNFTVGGDEVGTCDNVVITTLNQLTCVPSAWDDTLVIKPNFSKLVDINVTIDDGITHTDTLTDGYTYRVPMVVTSFNPSSGPVTGNELITIDGVNFLPPDFSSDYVLVDWTEFSGIPGTAQYIDTGISYLTTDSSIRLDVDVEYLRLQQGLTSAHEQLTGFRASNPTTANVWRFFISQNNTSLYATQGTNSTGSGVVLGSVTIGQRIAAGIDHLRNASLSHGYRNGSQIGVKTMVAPVVNTNSIYLGASHEPSGGVAYPSYARYYGFKITKNGAIVANYIPMKNTITGACGFWDTASFSFKTNNGSGGNLNCGPEKGYQVTDVVVTINDNTSGLCYIESISNTDIICTVPPGTVGIYDVIVEGAHEIITVEDGYTYAPVVTGVTTQFPNGAGHRNVGPTTGGNTVTVRGLGFEDGVSTPVVMVGDVVCGNVIVVSSSELTCIMPTLDPKHAVETVNVKVSIDGIDNVPPSISTADDYIFRNPMTITSVTPSKGLVDGGTEVVIVGTNLLPPSGLGGGISVIFNPTGSDPAPCNVASWTNTQIVCTTSSHDIGLVDVQVANDFESGVSSDIYEYISLILSSSTSLVAINLNPNVENYGLVTYGVKTNNPSGYQLMIKAINDVDIKSDVSCDQTSKFSPLSNVGGLLHSTWGWQASSSVPSTGQTNWRPMTLTNQLISSSASVSGSDGTTFDNHHVYFGAKASINQPPCTYQTQIMVTVIAN